MIKHDKHILLTKNTIVLASGNPGKLKEFQQLLAVLDVNIIPQKQLGIADIEETGITFVENALLKARHAAKASGLAAIPDDSGVMIDALGGAPGIYSARYAGTHGNNKANNEKILAKMQDVPIENCGANFHCCLVFVRDADDPEPIICSADWHGEILTAPQGKAGFGYDPIFFVPSHNCSAAELASTQKNEISHRAQAMRHLKRVLTVRLT